MIFVVKVESEGKLLGIKYLEHIQYVFLKKKGVKTLNI